MIQVQEIRNGETFTRTLDKSQEQYQQELATWQAENEKYLAEQATAMKEAGVEFGDRVEYHAVGAFNSVQIITGILIEGKYGWAQVSGTGRKKQRWHKGFRKA